MTFDEVLQGPSDKAKIIHALEVVDWYHFTPDGMKTGGNTSDEESAPWVKWSDIQAVIDKYE